MGNTSATGGYLAPIEILSPTAEDDLDDELQAIVVGITGLDGTLVRPRWQVNDPKQPDRSVNWCAIGITNTTPDANAAIVHRPGASVDDPAAYDEMQRHEILEVTASFYGPNGASYAAMLRDGFSIAQNREAMTARGLAYVDSQAAISAPELTNQGWIKRKDIPFRVRRIVIRSYPVLNIRSADGVVEAGTKPQFDTAVFDPAGFAAAAEVDTPFHVEP